MLQLHELTRCDLCRFRGLGKWTAELVSSCCTELSVLFFTIRIASDFAMSSRWMFFSSNRNTQVSQFYCHVKARFISILWWVAILFLPCFEQGKVVLYFSVYLELFQLFVLSTRSSVWNIWLCLESLSEIVMALWKSWRFEFAIFSEIADFDNRGFISAQSTFLFAIVLSLVASRTWCYSSVKLSEVYLY